MWTEKESKWLYIRHYHYLPAGRWKRNGASKTTTMSLHLRHVPCRNLITGQESYVNSLYYHSKYQVYQSKENYGTSVSPALFPSKFDGRREINDEENHLASTIITSSSIISFLAFAAAACLFWRVTCDGYRGSARLLPMVLTSYWQSFNSWRLISNDFFFPNSIGAPEPLILVLYQNKTDDVKMTEFCLTVL